MMLRALALILAAAAPAAAESILEVQPVTDGVWALVGPMEQRSAANLANNATFGVVVTEAGVVLIDPGGSWAGAAAIDAAIDSITDKPVVWVIDTGGQDHRWLGNGYWKAQGATIIASEDAVTDQADRASMQLTALARFLGETIAGTEPVFADITFADSHTLEFGGLTFEITHPGAAHTPGDSFVWVPAKNTVFTGDIVYVERILGVGAQSAAKDWIECFRAIEALAPGHVVPGHGHATTLEAAQAETLAYLVNLRDQIGALIEEGGDIIDAPKVDQSAFAHLLQFDDLAGRNAQAVYEQMEWE